MLAAIDLSVVAPILIRLVHILAAIAAGGAVVFQLLAVHPSLSAIPETQRGEFRAWVVNRWRPIVYLLMALLLVTGLVTYVVYRIPEYKTHASKGAYHGLLGAKILLALAFFHAATVLTLPGSKGDKYRAAAGFWLRWMTALLLGIVALGAVLRYFAKLFPAV
ncbi:hypothetical protein RAS1_31060 [Phycisphaerae bacterium RAS1]|nr:hypothetical protein RAS1_31060 [Phycisphaerae bacterium RAS1]